MEKIQLCNIMAQFRLKMRQKYIETFQDPESKARFFVGNPQTGGYGITLTAANTVVIILMDMT